MFQIKHKLSNNLPFGKNPAYLSAATIKTGLLSNKIDYNKKKKTNCGNMKKKIITSIISHQIMDWNWPTFQNTAVICLRHGIHSRRARAWEQYKILQEKDYTSLVWQSKQRT